MNAELSIHHVSSIEMQRHVFDGFYNSDLTIRADDGTVVKIVLYSRVGEIAIVESAPAEDHRKEAV